jgi:hypothetical protein
MNEETRRFCEVLLSTPQLGSKIANVLVTKRLVKLDSFLWPEDQRWPLRDWRRFPEHATVDFAAIREALNSGRVHQFRNLGAKCISLLDKIVIPDRSNGLRSTAQMKKDALSSSRFIRLRQRRGLPFKSRRQP